MADFEFEFVTTAQLDDVFTAQVLPRLPILCKKAGIQWTPGVLRALLDNHTLLLCVVTKAARIVGIVLLQECTDIFTAARYLYVWAAHFDRCKGILAFFSRTLDELANVFQYAYIQFPSSRLGWHKMKGDHWRVAYSVWEKQYG